MNIVRLQILADFLRNVSPETFDMDTWWDRKYKSPCGFAGGWACFIPEFKQDGLEINDDPYYSGSIKYGNLYGLNALARFFDLEIYVARRKNLAREIFLSDYYPKPVTPNMVADKIEEVIAREQARMVDAST